MACACCQAGQFRRRDATTPRGIGAGARQHGGGRRTCLSKVYLVAPCDQRAALWPPASIHQDRCKKKENRRKGKGALRAESYICSRTIVLQKIITMPSRFRRGEFYRACRQQEQHEPPFGGVPAPSGICRACKWTSWCCAAPGLVHRCTRRSPRTAPHSVQP